MIKDSGMQRKPSHATIKSTIFAISKDEWNTKEDTGKYMKNALYVLQYAKGISWAEAMSNNESVLSCASLEAQSVSQLEENSFK